MRIILSRKGMDSGAGGMASPILPDGTMISLPIPENEDKVKDAHTSYGQIFYEDKNGHDPFSYAKIIKDLSNRETCPKGKDAAAGEVSWERKKCHVDPDLRDRYAESEEKRWNPAFGQHGASQSHLQHHNPPVDSGDIFLFYGWFRYVEFTDGKFQYITKGREASRGKHVIWGYMQVGDIITDSKEIQARFPYHPHTQEYYLTDSKNAIYLPRGGRNGTLTFDSSKKSYGLLKYDRDRGRYDFDEKHILDLTKEGHVRSHWDLDRLKKDNIEITYHKGKLGFSPDRDYFQSSCQGQEFIIDPPVTEKSELMKWLKEILSFAAADE